MWNEQLVFSLDGGGTVTVTNANVWQGGLTIEQSVSSDGFFEIGSTHVGQMTVTLVDTFDDIDFQNATVVVSMAKDSDTLQQMGVYTVVRSERDNGILGITAYDNMTLLSEPYTTSLSFPSTYGAMANEIVGTTIQFDGSTTAVQSAPEFEAGTTKREVLGYIAQACGYNVKCNASGYIEFARYNMSGFNTSGAYHEISSLFDFHHSYYPVVITGAKVIVRTIVSTTDSDTGETTTEEVVNTYTSGTDDYQIVIDGNPLITTANGQAVANTIFATFGGVEFYTGSVTHLSDLTIKASDIMKVTDRTGTTYPMLVSSTVISTGSPQISQSFAEEPASKLSVQPSIIDRVQTSVRQALLDAKNSMNKANYASQIAGNTNQYFWHTETGTDTGAHITEIPKEDFLDDPTNGGGNLLARSNGVAVRDGLRELSRFSGDGLEVLGYDDNDNEVEIAHLGYGEARDYTMQMTTAPYATIGYRLPNNIIGAYSTAEGHSTIASGYVAHAEGALTTASGGNSHAEGGGTVASGSNSHAGGLGTIASGANQTAIGKYNVEDIYGDNLFIVGNGTGANARSNAFAVTSRGELVAGGVKSYTPTWETGQNPYSNYSHCIVSAGICSFGYMGAAVAHSVGDSIGTLPVAARPTYDIRVPFIKMNGGVVGVLVITTAGAISIGAISDTSNTGRIYFNCSFPVV